MASKLVIVESPAKGGTIQKYLGPDFQVVASMGHIRDLPSSKLGVDLAEQFKPQYVIPPKARPNLKKLKEALKGKEVVYLATDLDREGEAIAWHVAQALDLDSQTKIQVQRITFDEITQIAIQAAITAPREINYKLVDAQQARRVLDRLVGYTLSPVLWKKLYKGLSAGRVQSVALRLIVEREAERDLFKPQEYWSVEAELKDQTGPVFKAKLTEWAGKKIEQLTLGSKTEADQIESALAGANYKVEKVERKTVTRRPQAPYTTASFQQDAVNRLGMSAKQAMRAAQQLYEAGRITYMRTDSVELAGEALTAIRQYVTSEFGQNYLPDKPHFYKTKTKQAQEAHEAIRPTDPSLKPEAVSGESSLQKVYGLIRSRTLASQMAVAELEQTGIDISAAQGLFRATGTRIVFPGFLKVMPAAKEETQELPLLKEGQALNLEQLLVEQHFTEPPPRFTEASLIKALEENGIGRPSTYAPTIETLVNRKYVILEQRRLIPESIGIEVTKLLTEHFPQIVDLNFTAKMEAQLDDVATGQAKYQEVLQAFWDPFHALVETKTTEIAKVNMTEESSEICPTCQAPMVIKTGRFGRFLACTRFPDCKTTKPLNAAPPTGLSCPLDGKELVWKRAKRGNFIGCSGYPTCTFALWKRDQLPKKLEELEAAGTPVPFKQEALTAFQAPLPTN